MRVLACGVVASFVLWSALTWCAVCASSAEDSGTLSVMTLDLSASLTFIGLAATAVGLWVATRSPEDREIDRSPLESAVEE